MVDRERFLVVLMMMMMLFPKRQDAFLGDRYFLFKVSNLIPFFYVMKGKKDDHHQQQTTP